MPEPTAVEGLPRPTKGAPPDLAVRAARRRKREDTALMLPILGILLLCTPLLDVFAALDRVLGLPALVIYVFSVWMGLICLTAAVARRMEP